MIKVVRATVGILKYYKIIFIAIVHGHRTYGATMKYKFTENILIYKIYTFIAITTHACVRALKLFFSNNENNSEFPRIILIKKYPKINI